MRTKFAYTVEALSDGVSRVLERYISEDWRCNIWHIKGRDRDLIIDTGMGLWPIAQDVVALRERNVIAFCTHSHHDHAGGFSQFETRLSHRAESEIFARPNRNSTVAELLNDKVITVLPYEGFTVENWCYEPAPLTKQVDEGDFIDLGDRTFYVLHLPGHSPGSTGLWEKETGLLFTGDALYDGTLYDHLYHSVPIALCESLKRIREMPVNTVHAGHYTSFDRNRMQVIIDEYLSGQLTMICPSKRG
ncbi:MAG: MBL fold metallo-hydrolase [Rhodobacteraceae bacterium]|nr:MBL fold metallo-hydrolase [Paracoccaceae bacterium]